MELNIGITIRRLRQENGITQEELANAIGVTAQAVSKWERVEGYPDITLLPDIAAFFDVTLDTICGIDENQKRKEIASILQMTVNASYAEGVRIAREGLDRFPHSFRLKKNLATALTGCTAKWIPPKEVLEEVIRIYEDIIQHCTDLQLRNSAVLELSQVYALANDHEKAKHTVLQIYGKYENQRAWCQILKGEELVSHIQNSIIQTLPDIHFMLKYILETPCYTTKEKITLCRKMIEIYSIIDECHNWPVGMFFSYQLYLQIAVLSMEFDDTIECLNALNSAADLAVQIDLLPCEGFPDSLLLNRINFEYLYGAESERELLRKELDTESAFDPLRETPEYAMVIAKLK